MQLNSLKVHTIPTHWQTELADAFCSCAELCRYLKLNTEQLPISNRAQADFPLKVPISFAECMEKGNPKDPLLRQVLPISEELKTVAGYVADPVGDLEARSETGVIHKYHGRVLLIVTGGCAINCRYCFRRNFPYSDNSINVQYQQSALNYIRQHSELREVILSGGDPLLLNDRRLSTLLLEIDAIKHIERIRIHSRIPVVLPSRIDAGLLTLLQKLTKNIIVVIHSNHGNELSSKVAQACQTLVQQGHTVLNQSVLLAGVNDNPEVLVTLSERLFAIGVLPYYLHLLDQAAGTAQFEVPESQALQLMHQIQKQLPGYITPKLVREKAGVKHKLIIS